MQDANGQEKQWYWIYNTFTKPDGTKSSGYRVLTDEQFEQLKQENGYAFSTADAWENALNPTD